MVEATVRSGSTNSAISACYQLPPIGWGEPFILCPQSTTICLRCAAMAMQPQANLVVKSDPQRQSACGLRRSAQHLEDAHVAPHNASLPHWFTRCRDAPAMVRDGRGAECRILLPAG